jgi:hypothetical protein
MCFRVPNTTRIIGIFNFIFAEDCVINSLRVKERGEREEDHVLLGIRMGFILALIWGSLNFIWRSTLGSDTWRCLHILDRCLNRVHSHLRVFALGRDLQKGGSRHDKAIFDCENFLLMMLTLRAFLLLPYQSRFADIVRVIPQRHQFLDT